MAKYEVIARGIFVKEKGKIRELQLGEVITEPDEHLLPKLRIMTELEKSFEVATPQQKTTKKKKAE
ncbi:hypothetical protein LOH90_004309 [Salmonella enterica]|nr:hypothetical protein [Salmonella enterica]